MRDERPLVGPARAVGGCSRNWNHGTPVTYTHPDTHGGKGKEPTGGLGRAREELHGPPVPGNDSKNHSLFVLVYYYGRRVVEGWWKASSLGLAWPPFAKREICDDSRLGSVLHHRTLEDGTAERGFRPVITPINAPHRSRYDERCMYSY